ncbi:MAG: bifunctional diaminohydroxyphosphoribosylaminopyrimidine deaminase/5-amino-6-(5-phosphoribosylamino)uracil reductase RibD, partial [Solirubrobacterales bacterium]
VSADPATQQDDHLARALELAARARRAAVSPNPLVGAVIVRDGETIGEGFHARVGDLHAERAAIDDCRRRGNVPAGATMFVSLEPCGHSGRQPPCAEAILEARLARVVYASDDPSEKASGRGPGMLRDGGVEIDQAAGEQAAAARLLNQPFRKHARTGRPLVMLKMAASLDGFVATADGDSKWISGESSRELVHRWRAEADAVAVGIGTALADDPLLTARDVDAVRQPARVVFDSEARLPLDSRLVESVGEAPLFIVIGPGADSGRAGELERAGGELVVVAGRDRSDRIAAALSELGRREVTSLLLEGGPVLAGSFAAAGAVDELRMFVAPLLLGGGRAPLEGPGAGAIAEAPRALSLESEPSGDDLLIRARLREW